MILPIRTDSPLRRTPWMNRALIAANVLIFLGQLSFGEEAYRPWMLWPQTPELTSYFSYAFLHGGWGHLLSNMLFLYIFGNNVNDKLGHLGYLAFYLAGGVVAGIAYVLTNQSPGLPMLGASGAVSAVTGAFLVLFPRSTATVLFFFILITFFHVHSMWLILFFFLKDVVLWMMDMPGVAYEAHIGGTVYGVGVCAALLLVRLLPRDHYDMVALISQWNRRRQYRAIVRGGFDPFGPGEAVRQDPRRPPPLPDPVSSKVQDLRAEIAESIAHHKLPHAAALFLDLRSIDPNQVLSRQAQLDIANQLATEQRFPQAADAYEQFLSYYPNAEQVGQVKLMLGLIYARYLMQYDRAAELLQDAVERLGQSREAEMARAELAHIQPHLTGRTTP